MEILTKENLVGAKIAPAAVSKTFTPLPRKPGFLSKDSLLPQPESDGNQQTLGVGVETGS